MKKIIILLITLTLGVITSCEENRGEKAPQSKRLELDSTSRYWDQNYKVYTLEGCEYIAVGSGKERWGSHKGNCKNPTHKENNEESDTSYFLDKKHFDCVVVECDYDKESKSYLVTTECGIFFYSKNNYRKNTILKNFKSPKHE